MWVTYVKRGINKPFQCGFQTGSGLSPVVMFPQDLQKTLPALDIFSNAVNVL